MATSLLNRAEGAFWGQLAGDALGSVVESCTPEQIARQFPQGIEMIQSPVWHTLAGQPTDDSELAIELGWALLECGRGGFDDRTVALAYHRWFTSDPFDVGQSITTALSAIDPRDPQPEDAARSAASASSEANGALMRQVTLAIWGHRLTLEELLEATARDCSLTHPNPVCVASSQIFVATVARCLQEALTPDQAYGWALQVAAAAGAPPAVRAVLKAAATTLPIAHGGHQGHVIIALQNAFYQLLHAPTMAAGLRHSVQLGGDADTNAAVAGALLGSIHGKDALPPDWLAIMQACYPMHHLPQVRHPRPPRYWPVVASVLPRLLVAVGEQVR